MAFIVFVILRIENLLRICITDLYFSILFVITQPLLLSIPAVILFQGSNFNP